MSAPRAPLPAGPALIPAGCAYSGRVLFRGLARVEGRLEGLTAGPPMAFARPGSQEALAQ